MECRRRLSSTQCWSAGHRCWRHRRQTRGRTTCGEETKTSRYVAALNTTHHVASTLHSRLHSTSNDQRCTTATTIISTSFPSKRPAGCCIGWCVFLVCLLRELHWLRVPDRITFRLCVLAYRCLHGTAPSYLAGSLLRTSHVDTRRRLRSADTAMLILPSTKRSTLGNRAFLVASAREWNNLPSSVRNAPSLTTFRRELKTVLFRLSFDNVYLRLLTVGASIVFVCFCFV